MPGGFDGPRYGALSVLLGGEAMDRFAVFVDAGYLLAAGGTLCCDTITRGRCRFCRVSPDYSPKAAHSLITACGNAGSVPAGFDALPSSLSLDCARDREPVERLKTNPG